MSNKQEALAELKELKPNRNIYWSYNTEECNLYEAGFLEFSTKALGIVQKIDDPEEKPMLSKVEVDWLEKLREVKHNTDEMIVTIARQNADCDFVFKSDGKLHKLSFERYKGKESYGSVRHRLLYAVIYGYETKPLYTVEIPNPNGSGYCKTYLAKNDEGKVELFTWSDYTSIEFADNWKQEENAQLTEEEIKEDYTWAWEQELHEEVK